MRSFDTDRRNLLKAGGAALMAGLAGCIGPFEDGRGMPGTTSYEGIEQDSGFDLEGYLSDAPNYGGEIADSTGEDSITIQCGGAEEIGAEGTFVFEPPAVEVDPGTDITWEWVGSATHSVTHQDETFNSGLQSGDGYTFTVEGVPEGVHPYFCQPHQSLGQIGVIVAGQMDSGPSRSEYLSDVPNWDGETVQDRTDQGEVTVMAGDAEAIGAEGTFVFDPPVIQVETGTTVTWEWVGSATHSVTAVNESFGSGLMSGEGETFEQTFDSAGENLYFCRPHESLGQKGSVIVVDPDSGGGDGGDSGDNSTGA
jgi:halocyanin-like protein